MTQQYIGVGAEPNDGQGTPIRNAFIITMTILVNFMREHRLSHLQIW